MVVRGTRRAQSDATWSLGVPISQRNLMKICTSAASIGFFLTNYPGSHGDFVEIFSVQSLSQFCVKYMHRSRCLMCQASSVAPIGRDFSHALQLLPLLQAFYIAQIGRFLSPRHCSNIAFYDSSNWAVLPRLHGSSIASIIPQIGHSSLHFIAAPLLALLTSDIPLSNHELNCFHCFPSFCIAQILDIPF